MRRLFHHRAQSQAGVGGVKVWLQPARLVLQPRDVLSAMSSQRGCSPKLGVGETKEGFLEEATCHQGKKGQRVVQAEGTAHAKPLRNISCFLPEPVFLSWLLGAGVSALISRCVLLCALAKDGLAALWAGKCQGWALGVTGTFCWWSCPGSLCLRPELPCVWLSPVRSC